MQSKDNEFKRKIVTTAVMIGAGVLLLAMGATAQENVRSEISVQGTGFFTKDSDGRGIHQQSTNTGGVLATYRYHFNRWLGAEGAYGWNHNSQLFFVPGGFARVQADVHQATGGFVVTLPTLSFFRGARPYVLAEGGALIFDPTNNFFGSVPGVQRQTEGVFVYGGGADFSALKHVALRVEYRGLIYNTPDFGLTNLSTNTITHTAQPSAGLVFRF